MAKDWQFIPLYGVAMQEAEASGDEQAMRTLVERARREGGDDPEIAHARERLEAALARGSRSEPRTLYAPPMQEALRSGDRQRMRELADRADREGSDDPEVRSLAGQLRAELDR